MDSIRKLTELFVRFPGIGPRQASRFVYFLLSASPSYRKELCQLILEIQDVVKVCASCKRYHSGHNNLCPICSDTNRDITTLLLVEKDVDLDNIERAKNYKGYYFVLGGNIPVLEKNPQNAIREKELVALVKKRLESGLTEIIFALSVTPEGEHTTSYLKKALLPTLEKTDVKSSILGRGLSTGSELEYSDSETIKNALQNRV